MKVLFKLGCGNGNSVIKFSIVAAIFALLPIQILSAEWEQVTTNVEDGTISKKFDRYTGAGKRVNITTETIDQNNLVNSIIVGLSDNNLNNNSEVRGFELGLKNMDLSGSKRFIIAAGSYSGNVLGNTLKITNSTDGYNVDVRAGHSYNATAKDNLLHITNSIIDKAHGGTSRSGIADNNRVIIDAGSEVRTVHGGRTWFSKNGAKGNEVEISASIAPWVYGGESQGGEVSQNKVTIKSQNGKKSLSRGVFGGKSIDGTRGDVSRNEVVIIGSDVEASYEKDSGVFGGRAGFGNANSNRVIIKSDAFNVSTIDTDVFGAQNLGKNIFGSTKPSEANKNEVFIIGSVINGDIYGSKSGGSDTGFNKIVAKKDGVNRVRTRNIYGGYTMSGGASNNNIEISGADIDGSIYGGYINDGFDKDANFNTVSIDDVSIGGSIYGGYNNGSQRHTINNTVNLLNKVRVEGIIAGGMFEDSGFGGVVDSDVKTGNTLNVYSKDVVAQNIKNFQNYNFFILKDTFRDSNILTVTGDDNTDLSGASVNVIFQGEPALNVGESINLIKRQNERGEILTDDMKVSSSVSGVLKDYVFDIQKSDSKTLKATLRSKKVNKQGESILATSAMPMDMASSLGDTMSDSISAIEFDLNALEVANLFGVNDFTKLAYADSLNYKSDVGYDYGVVQDRNLISFANLSGFRSRYDKSNMKVKGLVLSTGIANKINDNIYGVFVEGGRAKYDNDIANDGNVKTYGIGVFSRFNMLNDIYLDTILRTGRTKTKNNNPADYKIATPYYSASIGAGHKIYTDNFTIDNSVLYAYSYIGSDEANIGGADVKFYSSTSNKITIKSKISYSFGKFQPYMNFKFNYNLSGKSEIRAMQDDDIIGFTNKGSNYGGELGFRYMPTSSTQINLSIGRIFGKKDETSGRAEFVYKF